MEKLAAFLDSRSIPEPNSGCILWTGRVHSFGYGMVQVGGKNQYAHRTAWILAHGPIPKGLLVCHKCDVPACINPDHLFLGTHKENTHDAMKKGRLASGERSFAHRYPEKLPRGDAHPMRRFPEKRSRGENRPLAKLTDLYVREIRALAEQGVAQAELCKRYGVAPVTIHRVINRASWRHVI